MSPAMATNTRCASPSSSGRIIRLWAPSSASRADRIASSHAPAQRKRESAQVGDGHTPFLIAIKDVSGKLPLRQCRATATILPTGTKTSPAWRLPTDVPGPGQKRFRDEELMTLRRSELIEVEEIVDTRRGARWLHQVRFPLTDSAGEVYALASR